MPILYKRIRKILPVLALPLCASLLGAQAQAPKNGPGQGEKPMNPPPYANQPDTGIAKPPEGTTVHDAAGNQQTNKDTDKNKGKTKKKRTKKTQQSQNQKP